MQPKAYTATLKADCLPKPKPKPKPKGTPQQFNICVHWTLWLCHETPILQPNDSDPLGLRVYIQDKELVWLIEPRVLLLNMVLDI
jgi:hypothetical protein